VASFLVEDGALGCDLMGDQIFSGFKRRSKTAIVAVLAIAGLIVGDAKEPTANIFLRAAGCEVMVQTKEGVLDNILRFVAGKPEANEIAK